MEKRMMVRAEGVLKSRRSQGRQLLTFKLLWALSVSSLKKKLFKNLHKDTTFK